MKLARLNPTLFDKLTLSDRVTTILDAGRTEMQAINERAQQSAPASVERYTEAALRASVRRELVWLLNTVNLEACQDLSAAPEVRTSVLNYGCPDLTGRLADAKSIEARSREMERAIRTFEPRLEPSKLHVEAKPGVDEHNAIAYVIHGDVTTAVKALPVQFFASVEVETGQADVQD